jgi:RNA polymerase sigma-70 factor (ECF subfamily)
MDKIEEIISEYSDLIADYALSIAHDKDLADDIMQDCYLKIINNNLLLARLTPNQIRSWLFTVIKNILIDKKRKKRIENIPLEIATSYEDNLVLTSQVEILLDYLPEDERNIIYNKYWLGMNSQEIAGEMNMSASTVRWKLQKALSSLRQKVGDSLWKQDYYL